MLVVPFTFEINFTQKKLLEVLFYIKIEEKLGQNTRLKYADGS